MGDRSIVEIYPDEGPCECGYCHSNNSLSQGLWAHSMTCEDYQALIDQGWRRSGKYCYKPVMDKTCCPQYTIKCRVEDFKLSKSQKKVLKKMEKYLREGSEGCPSRETPRRTPDEHAVDDEENEISVPHPMPVIKMDVSPAFRRSSDSEHRASPRRGHGADPSRPPCKKAKLIRLERKAAKLAAASASVAGGDNLGTSPLNSASRAEPKESGGKSQFEDLILNTSADCRHQLELRLVRSCPPSQEFSDTLDESWRLYRKYQVAVHGDSEEDCTRDRYERFLVHSPLIEERFPGAAGYGSFHHQYWLDGKLICVGVLDILPHCVSSVYLYYDPDFRALTLGTYSSLREIALTRSLMRVNPDLQYYYMGYYLHSCEKMRYKGQYSPSSLLCPETYLWFPIESCLPKLDASKYSRLADSDGVPKRSEHECVTDCVLVLFRRTPMLYRVYKSQVRRLTGRNPTDEDEVKMYACLVGPECANRMLLYRATPKTNTDDDEDDDDSS